jgi:hypothetical protein
MTEQEAFIEADFALMATYLKDRAESLGFTFKLTKAEAQKLIIIRAKTKVIMIDYQITITGDFQNSCINCGFYNAKEPNGNQLPSEDVFYFPEPMGSDVVWCQEGEILRHTMLPDGKPLPSIADTWFNKLL